MSEFNLVKASGEGNLLRIQELLDDGINVNSINGLPLITAVYNNHLPVVRELLRRGANPNIRRGSAFIQAVNSGYSVIVQVLLSYGANINILSQNGRIRCLGLVATPISSSEYHRLESTLLSIENFSDRYLLMTSDRSYVLIK